MKEYIETNSVAVVVFVVSERTKLLALLLLASIATIPLLLLLFVSDYFLSTLLLFASTSSLPLRLGFVAVLTHCAIIRVSVLLNAINSVKRNQTIGLVIERFFHRERSSKRRGVRRQKKKRHSKVYYSELQLRFNESLN